MFVIPLQLLGRRLFCTIIFKRNSFTVKVNTARTLPKILKVGS